MTNEEQQSIFQSFGPNWNHAGIDAFGKAYVFQVFPTQTSLGALKTKNHDDVSDCPAFNPAMAPNEDYPVTIWCREDFSNGPAYNTDQFGGPLFAELPAPLPPAPAMPPEAGMPFTGVPPIAPLKPFMEYADKYMLVGSRVTCDPAPLNTDQDVLVLVAPWSLRTMEDAMVAVGFKFEGSAPTDASEQVDAGRAFTSLRRFDMNYILTASPEFYDKFAVATGIAKRRNLSTKAERIALFQGVLYENGPAPEELQTDASLLPLHADDDVSLELENKIKKLKRRIDRIGQRVEFLVEHDHFDYATGLMILTGLPQ